MTPPQQTTDAPATAEDGGTIKPFAQVLREQRDGELHTELSQAMNELVTQCVETGKKGSLTFKITIAPQKDEVTMHVTDDVKLVLPKVPARPAVFFFDAGGNLQRNDPRRIEIPGLREVDAPAPAAATQKLKEAPGA